ncbi:Capsule biosynthesis GfcC [compost metagenome]
MKYPMMLWACLLLASPAVSQAAVSVRGDVQNAGEFEVAPDARLLTIITAAKPNAEGYWLAAAWLHRPLLKQQDRLKVGVLFDLKMVERTALLDNKPSRAALAARLHETVRLLPVTGRKVTVLDPVAIETAFARNYPVADGDQFIYPQRPSTVEVVGAVAQPCVLPFVEMQQARDYLQACTPLADAEADFLWLIQPNGQVRRVAIAAWNREDGVIAAAGSKILVPIKNDDLDPPTPDLNQQLAEFIATQPLAEVAP